MKRLLLNSSHVKFDGPFEPLPDSEREFSLHKFLDQMPSGDPWVFAYGSLMWDLNGFSHKEKESAVLYGFHRQFCIWTVLARGTPELPGLAVGLERGGSCRGIAFRVDRHKAAEVLDALWRREMHTACYDPRWVTVTLSDRKIIATTFVARHVDSQYAGRLAEDVIAFHIAHAHGQRGSCYEYLAETVDNLRILGVRNRSFERVLSQVDYLRNNQDSLVD